jgi:hypothetical protein
VAPGSIDGEPQRRAVRVAGVVEDDLLRRLRVVDEVDVLPDRDHRPAGAKP